MSARSFLRALALALVAFAPVPALAQGSDAEAELAAAKFLVEQKGLATQTTAKEQWLGTYAGPFWTTTSKIAVVDKDEANGGMRRFDLMKITSRDPGNPAREVESWWVDASGALVKGERRVFDEGADAPKESGKYEFKNGKMKITYTSAGDDGAEKTEKSDESELPASFVPDSLVVVVLLPPDKGKSWKFSTWAADDILPFVVTDLGQEKVQGRKGEVDARHLVVKDKEGEVSYWLDSEKRIVRQSWAAYPNLASLAGTQDEARADWTARPADETDARTEKVVAGALDKLAGELVYGVCDKTGKARQTFQATLKKEDKDGKPAYHYIGTTAVIGTNVSTVEDWWLGADGAPLSAVVKHTWADEKSQTSVKLDGKRLVLHSDDAADESKKDTVVEGAPHFTPDAIFWLRALAKEESGTFRFSSVDTVSGTPLSIWCEIKGTETVKTRSGEVKAKHVSLLQNTAEAQCWIDDAGKLLLVRWGDGDIYVGASSLDEAKKDVKSLGTAGGEGE